MKNGMIFSPAEILLPKFSEDCEKMNKWAVIACDQFTSDIGYWNECSRIIGEYPSTYRYILPEAYLGKDCADSHNEVIRNSMNQFDSSEMSVLNGFIYLERVLPNGKIRHGLIGKIDLEKYDYSVGSKSSVRATEATVVERIPPRCAVRASAVIELPHILILIDDSCGVFEKADALKSSAHTVYDFDLMQGGGHVTGYSFEDDLLDQMAEKICEYEEKAGEVVYAMGDGNHSLAAAKALWEQRKSEGASEDDPSRYALCEITALGDVSLEFEPIYRVLKNVNCDNFCYELGKISAPGAGNQTVEMIVGKERSALHFTRESHALTVGTLQNFIDSYIKANPETECDYIHGEDVLVRLASEENSIGFLMSGMDKNELFGYVAAHGTLPRKTFSMGEAESKRYYLEARKIVK